MLVGSVRRDSGFEPVLKVKVPVTSKEAPGFVFLHGGPHGAGGWWHLGEGDTHLSENGRAETVNLS